MKRISWFSSSLVIVLLSVALKSTAADGKIDYKKDPATGVRYLFFKQNSPAVKPAAGDIAFVCVTYKRDDDSLLFDSRTGGHTDSTGSFPLNLKSVFQGSLEQGIQMMSVGDSASFLINADSLYIKAFKLKALPHFIKEGSDLKFYVKLIRFATPDQLKDEQHTKVEKRFDELKKIQNSEADSIKRYLTKNNIKTKPTMVDSIYILERSGGNMIRPIEEGDSIEVKYTGMLLNGTIFDQSNKGDGGKATYKLLFKHNAQLIKGWIEVLSTMHEGEKVRFLLPSSMAYGPFGASKSIPAFTPLLFEIEVIKVISPFDK